MTLFIFLHSPVRTVPLTYVAAYVSVAADPDPHHFLNLEPHKSRFWIAWFDEYEYR